jgi:hypothetical protein
MLHLPKPLVSANLYCDRHLDDVVHRVVAPFWREASAVVPRSVGYLWFIRYSRCGEHVKLRLHAPAEQRGYLQERLESFTRAFFAGLPADLEPAERQVNLTLPPIDPEDAAEVAYPDRTLLWTDYKPSPITVGSEALLPDERLLALFTRCLAAGTEVVLQALAPDPQGEFTWRMRQGLVIKLVMTVLAGLPFGPEQIQDYLAYHRDWLIRYMLFRGSTAATEEELLAKYEARVRETPATVATLRGILESLAASPATAAELDDDEHGRLSLRVRDLYGYIVRFRAATAPVLDPYAPDQVFLPLFKCLHGLSNQVGLGMAREAQVYHLLAGAAAGLAPAVPVVPAGAEAAREVA